MKRIVWLLVTLTLILGIPQGALTDGIIIIDPPPEPPVDWTPWLTIRYHRVTVTIEEQVAITKVDQVFCNEGSSAAEGTYIFPLPPGATVQRFVMWVDGQPVEGEILPADKAREIYEGYVRQRRDPALLEYVGRDTVRARIFPIPPGGERRIELEYTQVLPMENGLMYYRYPLDTERFSTRPLEQLSIYVEIRSPADLRAIYSPSHQEEVVITRKGNREATISYEAGQILPNRDFELYTSTGMEDIGANLLSYKPSAEDGFFLLMLSPAIAAAHQQVLAQDVFLVLDTSGSMDGEKLEQAQAALVYILEHLNPEDRFNVVAFSSDVRAFAEAPRPSAATRDAIPWVMNLEALGGTNIYLALSEALAQADATRPTLVIFLTDGLPTEGIVEEATILKMLAQETPGAARIFPFGVGYDVNTLFLDQLAQDHRGRPAYVKPDERIDEQVSAFYARVQSPLLTNATLDFGDVRVYDVYPQPLTDLYAGTQLIVAGRYSGAGPQRIKLSGEVNGELQEYGYGGVFADHSEGGDKLAFIPRLWAARKIGYLLTQIRLHGENAEWTEAIVTLSLRYGIITPYTSFLVEEPTNVLSQEGRYGATEEFEKSLEGAPAATGEQAVEDAELRAGLGGAAAPPAADESLSAAGDRRYVRYVGDKTFLCDNAACTDTLFIPDKMTAQEILFMSPQYWEILGAHPDWAAYFALNTETIFVAPEGAAYRFLFGTAADEVARPSEQVAPPTTTPPTALSDPTPTPSADSTPAPTPAQPSAPGLCNGAALLLIVGIVLGRNRRQSPPGRHNAK